MKLSTDLISFLRSHEHQFQYCYDNYPSNVETWKIGQWNKFKNILGGSSNRTLNCWGLIFYAHFKIGLLDKEILIRKTKIINEFAKNYLIQRNISQDKYKNIILNDIRTTLLGSSNENEKLLPNYDFRKIPIGSTIIFSVNDSPASHAAIMLDKNQIAHIVQAAIPKFSLRPDILKGNLEITSVQNVIEIVKEMSENPIKLISIAHTNGPISFVKNNLRSAQEIYNDSQLFLRKSARG